MGDGDDLLAKKKEFFEAYFKKGAEFTEELLGENEKLRMHLLKMEMDLADKNRSYADRFHQIERENASLASLYVATYQMHQVGGPKQVLRTVLEILVNFVGAKVFTIYILDEGTRLLRPVAAEGMASPAPVTLGEGVIGRVAESGQAHDEGLGPRGPEPRLVVPLRAQDRVAGVLAVWEFLTQKTELLEVDDQLFQLLGAHAASALAGACIAAETGGAPPLRYDTLARLLGMPGAL